MFEPRPVEVSGIFGDMAIVGGIREGERVVVSGNFLLDSESRMRASGSSADGMPAAKPSVQPVAESKTKHGGVASTADVRDVVCGMTLKPADVAFQENYQGKTYSFCSDSCRKKFLADPQKYANQKANVAVIPTAEATERHD